MASYLSGKTGNGKRCQKEKEISYYYSAIK
jgi:hypothetical protein